MNKIIKPGRLSAVAIVLVVLMIIYMVTLYKLQIVEGQAYYEASQDNKVTTEDVPGARGSLMDRYGRVLVENRECNNILIDEKTLFTDDDPDWVAANNTILRLIELIAEHGDEHTDTLPITMESPFEYTEMTDAQRTMLNAYLADKDLPGDTTAVELMAYMRERYNIDNNYTSEETRLIAGVRYEINARHSYGFATADYIFVEDASMELITTLMENDLPGFRVETGYVRVVNTPYAAHILGYTAQMWAEEYEQTYSKLDYDLDTYVGKDGAEYAFEEYLHGSNGTARITSTAGGIVTSTVYTELPEPGNHVYLTIDIGQQEVVENALNSFITEENAERAQTRFEIETYGGDEEDILEDISGAGAVVVDVKTGEPLAIASWPTYDLANILEIYDEILAEENDPLFNRATQGTYAPGSTFKPVVGIAGLLEGKVDINTTIDCVGIFDKYEAAAYAPKCWIYGQGLHGELTLAEAVGHSCNLYFYTVGDYLQITKMAKYAKLFGLGESTGIELYEETGVMASDEYMQQKEGRDMYAGDTLQAAIGQSDSLFSPLQLAEYCAAIANGGTRYGASILKSVRSYDFSETLFEREAEVMSAVEAEEEYWAAIRQGMWYVANDPVYGTTYEAFLDTGYTVACKTGTSQLGTDRTNNAVFIAFAPYDDPEVAVAIVLEHGNAGSEAAPIARQILDYYFSFKDSTLALESDGMLLR